MGGEVDGVVEEGAACAAVAGDGTCACAGVDLGAVDRAANLAGVVGVVGEEVDVDVEGDQKGLVLGVRTSLRNSAPDCCSRGRTPFWLPLVSRRMPMVRGRFFSWV